MRRSVVAALAVCAMPIAGAFAQPVTNGGADGADPAVFAIVNTNDDVGCTASVIAPHTAITAAHCVVNRDLTTVRAFFGSEIFAGGVHIEISDARIHPGFDPGGRDVAVMTLRDPAPATPLALEGPLDTSLVGTTFRVVGYGLTGGGRTDAGNKREGTARVASLAAEEFTAVPGPSLSCLGDSGGPALLASGAIGGVVSRVDSLCVDHAVYTRIDIAQDNLIQPYLADTAPGTADEGEPCFYDGHCAAGLECGGETERVCASSAGCGCESSSGSAALPILVVLVVCAGRRRRLFARDH